MNCVFESYLESGLGYTFANGPDVIQTREDAAKKGLNCIALVHLLIRDLFDVELPKNLKSWEMFKDNPYFKDVDSTFSIKMGDIFFFGKSTLPSYAPFYKPIFNEDRELLNGSVGDMIIDGRYTGVHLAMYTGEDDGANDPLIIHSSKNVNLPDPNGINSIAIWPLSDFVTHKNYAVVHAIKRLDVPVI